MGQLIQRGGMGRGIGEYFDNSPFCTGYRAGTIQTIVPAPECWDVADGGGGGEYGPFQPAPSPATPIYTATGYGVAPSSSNVLVWFLLGAAALILLSDSGGGGRKRRR